MVKTILILVLFRNPQICYLAMYWLNDSVYFTIWQWIWIHVTKVPYRYDMWAWIMWNVYNKNCRSNICSYKILITKLRSLKLLNLFLPVHTLICPQVTKYSSHTNLTYAWDYLSWNQINENIISGVFAQWSERSTFSY